MKLRSVLLVLVLCSGCGSSGAAADEMSAWPDWTVFSKRFVESSGRVVDLTFDAKSTSEGQSYGLFFALVANEQAQFDTILKWTSDNLAAGQLGDRLPAWLWGKRADGSWGVQDENSASDSDLWIAYSLLEAARLWESPRYEVTGRKLLALIQQHEIAEAGSAGPVLLPGPMGFALDNGRFRINPSYLPDFMLRYLAAVDPEGPWRAVWAGYVRMTPEVFSAGVAPDLFVIDSRGVISPDSEREPAGSYDAIRVYLWAGMSGPSSRQQLDLLNGYAGLIGKYGQPPERVDPLTGLATKTDFSPLGFSGAVLPYLSALGDRPALERQLARIRTEARRAQLGATTHYYDQVLILFGKGWIDGQYGFDALGRLEPRWLK